MSQEETPSGPPTELGRLRILSSTAGIRVSPLALGGGNIGQKWQKTWGWGDMDKERAFKLLDTYYEVNIIKFPLSSLELLLIVHGN